MTLLGTRTGFYRVLAILECNFYLAQHVSNFQYDMMNFGGIQTFMQPGLY